MKAVSNLTKGKACGIDFVRNEFIKISVYLSIFHIKLFNSILNSGRFPKQWTTGIIIPIYKKKWKSSCPGNYRGITSISTLGKLFTKIINDWLDVSEKENKLIVNS